MTKLWSVEEEEDEVLILREDGDDEGAESDTADQSMLESVSVVESGVVSIVPRSSWS